MFSIVSITAPIFLLIALGFLAVRADRIPREGTIAMGRYVLSLALPALLFNAIAKRPLEQTIVPDFLLVYVSGSLIAFAVGVVAAATLRRTPIPDNAFFGMGVAMSNSGYIGYALISQLFGQAALTAVAMAILTEVLVILPLTLILAELRNQQGGRGILSTLGEVLPQVGKNPLVQAIAAGLICAGLGWQVPTLLGRTIDLLAGSAAAVALFAIGGGLAGQRLHTGTGAPLLIAAGKLLLHPAAVATMVLVVPAFDPELTRAAVILAALPMVTIFPLLAYRFGLGELCTSALLVTTVLSFVTLNLGLWAFGVQLHR